MKRQGKGRSSGGALPTEAPPVVQIVYHTDPLCAWSWALEPQWRRLRYEFAPGLRWTYRMAGMIPDWRHFHDPLNAIAQPGQMAPAWLEIAESTGMPLDARLWTEDPPQSSYPACLAFKAAQRQGPWAAEAYLRRLREAAMLQRRNVARPEMLEALAREVADELPPDLPFDARQFSRDLQDPAVRDALREDLKETRYQGVDRYPTLALSASGQTPILCIGYRPYEALRSAVCHLAPNLRPARAVTLVDYARYWGRLTLHELAVALDQTDAQAKRAVAAARRKGQLDGQEIV